MAGGFVEVINDGDQPLKLADNSVVTVVPAHGRNIVDREAAIRAFGDWTARNYPPDQRRMFRQQEYLRIRGHYGTLPGGLYQSKVNGPNGLVVQALDPDELWAERRPHVQVIENSQPVVLVIDDPDGKGLPVEAGAADKEQMMRTLVEQQAQMAAMIERLQGELHAERAAGIGVDMAEIPEDSPETAPSRRRQQMKIEAPRGDD